jgi:hypothetical protein
MNQNLELPVQNPNHVSFPLTKLGFPGEGRIIC